ncbi:MAG: zf-HC2 domain-containing protein [Anaerolineae bacterium]|nr:zf-HC2 domain-containing protein [Anaerolineae bacterium]
MNAHLDDETLTLFLDGELDRTTRLTAAQHLMQCPACRERLIQWNAFFTALDVTTTVPLPGAEPETRPILGSRRLLWLALEALLAVVLMAGSWERWVDLGRRLHTWNGNLLGQFTLWLASLHGLESDLRNLLSPVRDLQRIIPTPTAPGAPLAGWIAVALVLGIVWWFTNRWLLNESTHT